MTKLTTLISILLAITASVGAFNYWHPLIISACAILGVLLPLLNKEHNK